MPSMKATKQKIMNEVEDAGEKRQKKSTKKVTLCPFCKEKIAAGAIKCKHCESMLDTPNTMVAAAQEGRDPDKDVPIQDHPPKAKKEEKLLKTEINDQVL